MLQDEFIVPRTIINNTASSNQSSNSKVDDDVGSFFVKDLVNRKDFGGDYSILNLIKYVKETQISDCYNRIIEFMNINIKYLSDVQYQKLQIIDSILK